MRKYAILRASGLHDRRMKGFNMLCIVVPFWIILTLFQRLSRQVLLKLNIFKLLKKNFIIIEKPVAAAIESTLKEGKNDLDSDLMKNLESEISAVIDKLSVLPDEI